MKGPEIKNVIYMINGVEHKECRGEHSCGEMKPITEFYQNANGYWSNNCRPCKNGYVRQRRRAMTPEREKERWDREEIYKSLIPYPAPPRLPYNPRISGMFGGTPGL